MIDPRDEQIIVLANLIGRLAFLVQHIIGDGHATEIQREADGIRDTLARRAANSHGSET